MVSTYEASVTDVDVFRSGTSSSTLLDLPLARSPWQHQQEASAEHRQDVSLYQGNHFGGGLAEHSAATAATDTTAILPPWSRLPQYLPFSCTESTSPFSAPTEAGAGDRVGTSARATFVPYTNFLGDSSAAGGFGFPTSFTFAGRNTFDSATSLPIGSYLTFVSPLSTAAAPEADCNSNDNIIPSQTNQFHAPHTPFSSHINGLLGLHDQTRALLTPAQLSATEQSDPPAATSESLLPLIPLSQPSEQSIATTTTTVAPSDRLNSASPQATQPLPSTNVHRGTPNGTKPQRQAEGSDEIVRDDDRDQAFALENLPRPPNMPTTSTRKRSRAASCLDEVTGPSSSSNSNKRRTTNTTGHLPANSSRIPDRAVLDHWPEIPDSDDPFASDPFEQAEEEFKVFDLTKDDVRPQDLVAHNKKPEKEEDSRVRLAKFECIICMDSASNLTVTQCGHMFCGECLHQALHTDAMKMICPMCRRKLDARSKTYPVRPNAKTYFHLELKLMPSKRQGKQRAR